MKVYHAGMPDWKKQGGMELAETAGLRKLIDDEASFVLVDLRPEMAAMKGYIPGAVSVPAKELAKAAGRFPKDKKAPIYLYGDGVDVKAFKTVNGWGYSKVSVLSGGFTGWKTADGKIATGPLAREIVYVKRTPKGQVSIEEFRQVVEDQPPDKLILDVRDSSTAAGGMLKGALNIPADSVATSLEMIPRDREVLIHCNTGILAASAADALGKKGYNARYLNAVVQVSADGSYEISEK